MILLWKLIRHHLLSIIPFYTCIGITINAAMRAGVVLPDVFALDAAAVFSLNYSTQPLVCWKAKLTRISADVFS